MVDNCCRIIGCRRSIVMPLLQLRSLPTQKSWVVQQLILCSDECLLRTNHIHLLDWHKDWRWFLVVVFTIIRVSESFRGFKTHVIMPSFLANLPKNLLSRLRVSSVHYTVRFYPSGLILDGNYLILSVQHQIINRIHLVTWAYINLIPHYSGWINIRCLLFGVHASGNQNPFGWTTDITTNGCKAFGFSFNSEMTAVIKFARFKLLMLFQHFQSFLVPRLLTLGEKLLMTKVFIIEKLWT